MTEIARTQPGDYIALFEKLIQTGLFAFGTNEVGLRSLINDPVKFAVESASDAIGAWNARFIVYEPDGKTVKTTIEVALIQFKKDERTRGRHDVVYGEWTIHMKGPKRWEGQDASGKEDDGMYLVLLVLHDYIWWIGQLGPNPPVLILPPPIEPPADDWMSPTNYALHIKQLADINSEFDDGSGLQIDSSAYEAYLSGRNRNLKEVHDDMVQRAGRDPCGGTRFP